MSCQRNLPSAGHSCATYDLLRRSKSPPRHPPLQMPSGAEPQRTRSYRIRPSDRRRHGRTGSARRIHIRPEMIRLAHRVKGSSGIELITDSMRAKGMPDGKSELGGQTVYVKDGTARLEDGTNRRKRAPLYSGIPQLSCSSPVSAIEDAVQMSSVNQAREFGLTQKGAIAAGRDADFVLAGRCLHAERDSVPWEPSFFRHQASPRRQGIETEWHRRPFRLNNAVPLPEKDCFKGRYLKSRKDFAIQTFRLRNFFIQIPAHREAFSEKFTFAAFIL